MVRRLVLLMMLCALVATAARAQTAPARPLDIIFVPTPMEVVEAMLKAAGVTANDVVYDLGSGDGRIPIAAAKRYGATGVGVDLDPARVAEATANAAVAGVSDKVTFVEADLFTIDIRRATVVTLYLLPTLNVQLVPKLNRELKPGTRVLSHQFTIEGAAPMTTLNINGRLVYMWITPIVLTTPAR